MDDDATVLDDAMKRMILSRIVELCTLFDIAPYAGSYDLLLTIMGSSVEHLDVEMLPLGNALFGILNKQIPLLVARCDFTAAVTMIDDFAAKEKVTFSFHLAYAGHNLSTAVEAFGLVDHPALATVMKWANILDVVTAALNSTTPTQESSVIALGNIISLLRPLKKDEP